MTGKAYSDIARQYAEDVVAGTVIVCALALLACKRHLDDLTASEHPDSEFYFDASAADRVCRYIESLPHVKGRWAAAGESLVLEPFQCFMTCVLFGWKRRADGLRRFRLAYIEMPRKNAKSTWAAAVGNYMVTADNEHGAEVYCGATTEKQAWEVFRPARQMVDKEPELQEFYGVQVNAKSLSVANTASRFEPVIGKPGDGSSPHCAIIDEFHEHLQPDQYDSFQTGMGARDQPLLLIITTAGTDIEGPCARQRAYVVKVLEQSIDDPGCFGLIYTIDDGDDWTDPAVLRKANPNAGVSVRLDYLEDQQRKAIDDSTLQNTFKTKHLDVWTRARSPWLNMEVWHRCGNPGLSLFDDELKGARCWVGVDLASKDDIVSVAYLFEINGKLRYFAQHYLPEESATDSAHKRYHPWVNDRRIILTDGHMTDYARIEADLVDHDDRFQIVAVGGDPWQAHYLGSRLQEDFGFQFVEIPQNTKYFSDPMKHIQAELKGGKIEHGADPVLTWMVSNVSVKADAKENIFPRKDHPDNKIDGSVAAIMATWAYLNVKDKPRARINPYEVHGMRTL